MNDSFDPLLAIDAYLDGELDAAEQDRLRHWLSEDPAHADLLTERAFLHSRLSLIHTHRIDIPVEKFRPSRLSGTTPLGNLLNRALPEAIHPKRHRAAFLAAASLLTAIFCGSLLLMLWSPGGRNGGAGPAKSKFIAIITYTEKAVWVEGQTGVILGARLFSGHRLELEKGLVHLLFRGGARVVVEGPAQLSIDEAGAMILEEGRLLAHVSKQARGFTVETPTVDLIDLGTEFGVNVTDGVTELQVFEGKVQAYRHNDAGHWGRTLVAGQATVFGNSPQQGFYAKEKKMNRAIYLGLATVLTMSAPHLAEAVPVFYEASGTSDTLDDPFQAAAFGTLETQNFDGFANGVSVPSFTTSSFAINLTTFDTAGTPQGVMPTIFFSAGFPNPLTIGSSTLLNNSNAGSAARVRFDFTSGPVGSFGLWILDDSSNQHKFRFVVTEDGGAVSTSGFMGVGTNGLDGFLGVLSDVGLTSVIVESHNPSSTGSTFGVNFFEIDNVQIGPLPPPAPEPASGALLGLGGMMVVGFARRKRRQRKIA